MENTNLMHRSHLYANGYRSHHSVGLLISHRKRDKKERLAT